MVIVDAHVHLWHKTPRKSARRTRLLNFTAEKMLQVMLRNGVDRVVAMAYSGARGKELTYTENNEYIAQIIKKHPDKFAGFARINPWHDSALKELEKAVTVWGFKGLKLHPETDAFAPNSDLVKPLIEKAAKLKIPVIVHTHRPGRAQPALVGDIACRYPEVTFIMAHMGMALHQDALFVAKMCPNVILESSAQPWIHRIARRVIDEIGAERLIWGSDCPLHLQEVEKLKMNSANLSEDEALLVMGENILRIIGWK